MSMTDKMWAEAVRRADLILNGAGTDAELKQTALELASLVRTLQGERDPGDPHRGVQIGDGNKQNNVFND
jgi:hypothetical protein